MVVCLTLSEKLSSEKRHPEELFLEYRVVA